MGPIELFAIKNFGPSNDTDIVQALIDMAGALWGQRRWHEGDKLSHLSGMIVGEREGYIIGTHDAPMVRVSYLVEHADLADSCGYGRDPRDRWGCWEGKTSELNDIFIEDIMRDGIRTPVCFDPPNITLRNGHHRVIAAWLLDIEFISFTTDIDESTGDGEWCHGEFSAFSSMTAQKLGGW